MVAVVLVMVAVIVVVIVVVVVSVFVVVALMFSQNLLESWFLLLLADCFSLL